MNLKDTEFDRVFYIDVPENSGHITFENPKSFVSHTELLTYTNAAREQHNQYVQNFIKPIKGLLLIFPAIIFISGALLVLGSMSKR